MGRPTGLLLRTTINQSMSERITILCNQSMSERPDLSKIHLTACPYCSPDFLATQTTTR